MNFIVTLASWGCLLSIQQILSLVIHLLYLYRMDLVHLSEMFFFSTLSWLQNEYNLAKYYSAYVCEGFLSEIIIATVEL